MVNADGFYWSLHDDLWYRSPYWDHDFIPYPHEHVPAVVVRQPHEAYRHYRAPAQAERIYVHRGEHPHAHEHLHKG